MCCVWQHTLHIVSKQANFDWGLWSIFWVFVKLLNFCLSIFNNSHFRPLTAFSIRNLVFLLFDWWLSIQFFFSDYFRRLTLIFFLDIWHLKLRWVIDNKLLYLSECTRYRWTLSKLWFIELLIFSLKDCCLSINSILLINNHLMICINLEELS